MGDDVVLHTNSLITAEQRSKIVNWMEVYFNYKGKDGTKDPCKKGANPDDRSSFLKRVILDDGTLDTKSYDIWEKILCGPEYSKCRHSRMAYFSRRLRELTIGDPKKLEDICLYIAFIEL